MYHPFRPEQLSYDVRPSEADIQSVLLSAEQIAARVAELGAQISCDYEGKDPVLVGVLVGAAIFTSDLLRHLTIPCFLDFVAISSYGKESRSSGVVRIIKDLDESVESRHVVILEDIVDTGLTLNYLLESIRNRNVASVKVCSMFDKPSRRLTKVNVDYVGFEVPDEFVVGYGLDFAQRYRNLPYVGILRPEVYGGK
ncbi:MAG TPA: hypoxanthine phosphoribosyltransferase [Abditibacteriaceae bacterium]|nr:hypoxanthine phosphoribosyltransferase [Abditibacteriaceae bacterium]